MKYKVIIEFEGETKKEIKIVSMSGTVENKKELLYLLKKAVKTIKKYKEKHVYGEHQWNESQI